MTFKIAFMLVTAALPLSRVSGQTQAPETSSGWTLSLGADPSHFDLRTRDPGVDARFIGALNRSWATRFERVRLKAELMAGFEAPRGFRDPTGSLCAGCDINARRRFGSIGVGANLQLLRTSHFKTYLTGGTGIYHNWSFARSPLECTDSYCTTGGRPFYFWQSIRTSVGLNGGFGVGFRLGGREFFMQQSAHVFDLQGSRAIFPLTLGIGF
jgi:hypothetical protein